MDPLVELKAAFLEECDELLAALEARLAKLRDGSTSMDDINGAFRAIHSVKGGAGAFGMPALVQLAHVFEAALDHLRAGRIAPAAAPYELFLRALDQVGTLVSAARQGNALAAPADLVLDLQRVGLSAAPGGSQATEAAPDLAIPAQSGPIQIALRPNLDLFRRAIDVRHIFAGLEAMGQLRVKTRIGGLPSLREINPQNCHLMFDLELESEATDQQLAEVLEMQLGPDEFAIARNAAPVVAEPPARLIEPSPIVLTQSQPDPGPVSAPPPIPMEAPAPAPRIKAAAASSIRVDLQRIDRLMNLVGEIVITQSMLDQRLLSLPTAATMQIADGLQILSRQTRELQESVMAVRAQPVKNVFQRMPRLVRELCQALGKQARLQIIGEDTEVDKTIIEELADPLTHMIRNALDHGMETPDERRAAGKPPEGLVTLQAEQRSGRIVISVSDDGRGINRDRLLAKARARGLITASERPAPEEIDALLFHPGLSTAEAVTDVSGRGVGMDVVKQNVEALGGRVLVASEPGKGARFTLLLPLTLAVMDGMIIRSSGQRLVLPIVSIRETLQSADTTIECLPGGHEFLRHRDRLSPLVRLGEVLNFGRSNDEQVILMTETDRGSQIGLWVDEIIGQQQVVVKSLETSYGPVPGASAATILGDGLVALIIDVDSIPSICAPAILALRAATHPTQLQ